VLDTLQRLAAVVPPEFATLGLFVATALLTGVVGLVRRRRAILPDLPAPLYVVAAALAVVPGYAVRLPVWGRAALIAVALAALVVDLGRETDAPATAAVDSGGRRRSWPGQFYLVVAMVLGSLLLFWRLGTYAGSLLIWEESVINGFADAFRAGRGVWAYTRERFLWDNGLLSAGDTSLFYGAPTYALFHMAGFSRWTLRCMAPVATLLSVAVCYAATRRVFDRGVAVAASVLLSVNTSVLFYGRYGTSEAGTLLAVLLALWATWAFLGSDREAWWLGPVCGAALYLATLQYSPARLVVLVLLAFAPVVVVLQWRRFSWRRAVGVLGLAAVVAAVWRVEGRFGRQGEFLVARGEQVVTFLEHRDYIREYLGREIEPGTLTAFDKIELVYRVLETTVPEYVRLALPIVNPVPPGALIAVDPPPLPLYFAPLAVFIVWGLGASVAGWRAWPHACLLLWVGATSVPLLLTTRVDAHRVALLVIPICVWGALGIQRAVRALDRSGVPRSVQHGLACVLLATVVWADVNLLYFSPARVRSEFPYALHFGRYPVPHEPVAADALAAEIEALPGPVAAGVVLDPRDRGWLQLALLQRTWRHPQRTSMVLPEGLLNDLRAISAHPDAGARLVRMAREATILLAPAGLFPDVEAALGRHGLRVVQQWGSGVSFLRIDRPSGVGTRPDLPLRLPTVRGPVPDSTPQTTATGRRTWLSEMRPTEVTYGFSAPRFDRAWGGGAIEMGGTTYRRGIGVHAWTRMTFAVPPGATAFEAVIGLTDDTLECEPATVTFEVSNEAGGVLFDSGLIVRGDSPRAIHVAVSDIAPITLMVTEGGNGRDCDHANWADAAFLFDPVE